MYKYHQKLVKIGQNRTKSDSKLKDNRSEIITFSILHRLVLINSIEVEKIGQNRSKIGLKSVKIGLKSVFIVWHMHDSADKYDFHDKFEFSKFSKFDVKNETICP